MNLGDFSQNELATRLSNDGLTINVGQLTFLIRSSLPTLAAQIHELYGDYPLAPDNDFRHFQVSLHAVRRPAFFGAQMVEFRHDGKSPFMPMPISQAFPMLEWGLNWCVATSMNCWLVTHAAVLEKGGRCVILPGRPGAGKSTLTAVLANKGWRLFSDEHTLLDTASGALIPAPRPISLKNESIKLIRELFPNATMSAPVADTHKGTIAHMRPPADSISQAMTGANPGWVIFPNFRRGAKTELSSADKGPSLVELAENSFNYHIHGDHGFQALARLIEGAETFDLTYGNVLEAASLVEGLVA